MGDKKMNPWECLSRLPKDPDEKMRELAKFYQSVFSSADGQLVLEHLKVENFFYDTTVQEAFTEINEGRRQVILQIMKALSVDTTPILQPQGDNNE